MTFPSEPPLPPHAQPPTAPPPPTSQLTPVSPERPVIRWGLGDVLIGLALWLFGGIVASIVIIATGDGSNTSFTELSLGALAISLVCGWPGFLGWPVAATYLKGQRSLRLDFGLDVRPIDLAWGLLGGFVALVLSSLGGIVWMLISSDPSPSNTEFLPTKPSALTAFVIFFLVAICTPVVEELFFRGLFLRSLGRRWNLATAVIISSLVFGLFHAQGDTWGQAAFIVGVTATYGAVFAFLVIRANGRLGPSIVAHICVNAVGVLGALYL
jgi:membrane protease YdiL (CAAX protease family)